MTCNLNDLPPGAARVIQVTVTALNTNKRRKVTNTATVTCDVRGAPSAGCTDTAEDDITVGASVTNFDKLALPVCMS